MKERIHSRQKIGKKRKNRSLGKLRKKEGRNEGRKERKKERRKKGKKEGRKEGRKEGKKERRKEGRRGRRKDGGKDGLSKRVVAMGMDLTDHVVEVMSRTFAHRLSSWFFASSHFGYM